MAENETIEVLVLESGESLPGRRMVPGTDMVTARVVPLTIEAVKQGLQTATKQISEIVSELPSEDSAVRLDQISLDLNVSAEGNVQWIVGLGVAVGSTVTLTYKVSDAEGGGS